MSTMKVFTRLVQASRSFSTTAAVKSAKWQQQGIAGSTLPFGINNRWALMGWFVVFFGSGITAPFILVRHQMLKD